MDNHIFEGIFNAETAVLRAGKVMYAASCILTRHMMKPIQNPEEYHKADISKSQYKKLGKIRNFEPLGFAYVVESIQMLGL